MLVVWKLLLSENYETLRYDNDGDGDDGDDSDDDDGDNEEVALHVTNGRLGATLHTDNQTTAL